MLGYIHVDLYAKKQRDRMRGVEKKDKKDN